MSSREFLVAEKKTEKEKLWDRLDIRLDRAEAKTGNQLLSLEDRLKAMTTVLILTKIRDNWDREIVTIHLEEVEAVVLAQVRQAWEELPK